MAVNLYELVRRYEKEVVRLQDIINRKDDENKLLKLQNENMQLQRRLEFMERENASLRSKLQAVEYLESNPFGFRMTY